MIFPTRHRSKIAKSMSYPIGAEALAAALQDVPQSALISLAFRPGQWPSSSCPPHESDRLRSNQAVATLGYVESLASGAGHADRKVPENRFSCRPGRTNFVRIKHFQPKIFYNTVVTRHPSKTSRKWMAQPHRSSIVGTR